MTSSGTCGSLILCLQVIKLYTLNMHIKPNSLTRFGGLALIKLYTLNMHIKPNSDKVWWLSTIV